MEDVKELKCGCVQELAGGRWLITEYCCDHDPDESSQQTHVKFKRPLKKFKAHYDE